MDSDEGKLFIGGIAWDTNEDSLRDYFGQYGEVAQVVIMRDKITNRPRGFGFVVFADPSILDRVLQDKHTIDGRTVEAKRALSREEQQIPSRYGHSNASRSTGEAGRNRTKKIFVGGLPSSLTEDGFREYFESYGRVTDVVIMYDQSTKRPRGFGFISFDTEDAVDRVLHKTFHDLDSKQVEVKRALPRDASVGSGGRSGGHQAYGFGANAGSLDGRIDGNRFLQPLGAVGGYPPYSSYGAQSYGYGTANSGYSAYGDYGVGGYGGSGTGFGGPVGAFGNPNTGYISGPPGVLKGQWSSQTPGYGASGYSATGYGATAPWGGSVSAAMGQSPAGAGFVYGNYGGSEGLYSRGYGTVTGGGPNSSPVGRAGGEQQGTGGSYRGGGYGDVNAT